MEITHDFPPFFRVYKDGRVERFMVANDASPAVDPVTGVESKDVVISSETGVRARIFIPKINGPDQKLPLLIHYHGGGFCVGSPFDVVTQKLLTSLSSQAQVIAVSVDFRLAPEHPLPIAYDDSWAALQWIATHSKGQGPEPWINQYADLNRVFLAGESAGANIAHNVAVQAGATGLDGLKLRGLMIVHPFFVGKEPDKMIQYLYPTSNGSDDDPRLNPAVDPDLSKMGCERVFVCVAEKDWLKPRGLAYYEALKKSGWGGEMEFMENEGEDHCFHIFNPTIAHEFRFFRVYKDGRVEKFIRPTQKIPPSDDPITGVQSKDVIISTEPEISARIFLPRLTTPPHKLPVLFYIHGGGFSFESAFSPTYDRLVRTLAAEANVVAVSVEYRLALEHPIPACYDDCWAALQWVASHAKGDGPEPWLNHYADFEQVFLAGDSAGGNMSSNLAFRVGSIGLPGVRVVGAVLCHPYIGGVEYDDTMWLYLCPTNSGFDDPRMKPPVEDLAVLGCERVLVFVAEKDHLCGPGKAYCERLRKSGWGGMVEMVENEGEDHCFHLRDPTREKAVALIKKIVSFIKLE
ncbi:hypothetical protein F0562_028653 [Nyssa sinensis]|uniref:Alpha/beta hydrolase fold-3 domain-containing protein n=1 Tax=Nyssa sinensis TaxID=561372 RepID=A0A5J5AYK5_9ASTE|nr:hypothetical protein F0562_028653 [Nyssa sinensis]